MRPSSYWLKRLRDPHVVPSAEYQRAVGQQLKARRRLPAPRRRRRAHTWRHCCVTVGRVSDAGGDAHERAQDEDDDEDDDDDDDAEGAASKDEKDPAATWEEAMEIFEAHDAASRSRKAFDKWRVDGRGSRTSFRRGAFPRRAFSRRARRPPRRRRATAANRAGLPFGDGGGKTRRRSSDARRRLKRSQSSPEPDTLGDGAVTDAATGGEPSEVPAKSPETEASAEPPGEP